jgi:DNA-binding CsgD family transcriptional regulator
LSLSGKTILTHRGNLRKKLSANTDVDLCLIAIKSGLIGVLGEDTDAPRSVL